MDLLAVGLGNEHLDGLREVSGCQELWLKVDKGRSSLVESRRFRVMGAKLV